MAVDKLVDSTQLDADLTSVANAIRTKGGTSSQLAFPAGFVSAVQDIPTGTTPTLITKTITENGTYDAEDDDADGYSEVTVNVSGGSDTLEWKATRAGFPGFSGMYPGKNLIYNLNNKNANIVASSYMAMADGPNGKLQFTNLNSSLTGAYMSMSDFLRQAPCFQEVDLGGLAPSGVTRWFRDWGSNSQDGKFASVPVKVTNFCLDNLSSNNDSFSTPNVNDRYYHNFDVYFTGSFKNTMTLSGWTKLNADSWNRFIEHLEDYSQGTAHTLTVGSTILGMIDATHQAMAAARGWTLA